MKRFSYYNINGWICLYLALKNNLKSLKKGVDKRLAINISLRKAIASYLSHD